MGSKFPLIKLKDISLKITKGSTPTKKDGGFSIEGVHFIKAESASYDGVLDESKFVFVTEEVHTKYKRSQLAENDILFSMAGAFLGKTGLVEKRHLPANTNQALALIRVDSNLANPKYVIYCLQQRRIVHFVNNSISQSAQPNINLQQIGDLEIEFPNREIQDSIVNTLESVDKKISVNNQTNQTLEKMAQTLFKSWFVDFDPVFDNALAKADFNLENLPSAWPAALVQRATSRLQVLQDNPTLKAKLLQHNQAETENNTSPTRASQAENTHQHFPSEFEPTDEPSIGIKGWIPKGWGSVKLSEFIKFTNGKSHKGLKSGQYPLYGANGIIGYVDESKFDNGIIIGRVGAYCGAIEYCPNHFWASDNTIVATPKSGKEFNPYILNLLYDLNLNQYAGGAAQPLLNQATLGRICIPNANIKIKTIFSKVIGEKLRKIFFNNIQNNELTKLRDTLLPKLISGELQIPDNLDAVGNDD